MRYFSTIMICCFALGTQAQVSISTYLNVDFNKSFYKKPRQNHLSHDNYAISTSTGLTGQFSMSDKIALQIGLGYSKKEFSPNQNVEDIIFQHIQLFDLTSAHLATHRFSLLEFPLGINLTIKEFEYISLKSFLQVIPALKLNDFQSFGHYSPVSSYIDPITGLSSKTYENYNNTTDSFYGIRSQLGIAAFYRKSNHKISLSLSFSPINYKSAQPYILANSLGETINVYENQWKYLGQYSLGTSYTYVLGK